MAGNNRIILRIICICFAAIIIFAVIVRFFSNEKLKSVSSDFFAMDTYMTVTVYDKNADAVIDEAEKLAYYYESIFSVNIETSDITKLNNSSGNPVEVSPETYELIEKSIEYSKESEGLFDITIYPVVKEWGFTTGEHNIPSDERKKELLNRTGYQKVHLMQDNTVMLDEGCEIDLGGIAKGFLSQKMIELFKEKNVTGAVVSLGGNVQTYGMKPDKRAFSIGIADPSLKENIIGTISVKEKAVVTSGGYQRYFEEAGKIYHHIMDIRTGAPAESDLASVTVIADDGTYADAMATALYIMGERKAKEYQKSHPEIDVVLINTSGEIWTSKGVVSDDLR